MSTFWKSWVIVMLIAMMKLTGAGAEENRPVADVPNKDVQETGTATNHAAGEMPRLVHWLDYTGGLWHSAGLTGDWGGTRQQLMDKGIDRSSTASDSAGRDLYQGVITTVLASVITTWPLVTNSPESSKGGPRRSKEWNSTTTSP